jgi:hypothetical protein
VACVPTDRRPRSRSTSNRVGWPVGDGGE